MKIPFFGRKAQSSDQNMQPPPNRGGDHDARGSHGALLDHLRLIESDQPLARPQIAGRALFDMAVKMLKSDRGVRIEDLIAILASNGGFCCIVTAIGLLGSDAPEGSSLVAVTGKDGHRYYYGDLPNRFLVEDKHGLLNLVLGMAQACGGNVSLDMAVETMSRVAMTVGGEDFGQPELPTEHRLSDLPFNYVRFLWPKFREMLRFYEVPFEQQPLVFGFALQRAIEEGKSVIDPVLAARIAVECAIPMAKIDPHRFAQDLLPEAT